MLRIALARLRSRSTSSLRVPFARVSRCPRATRMFAPQLLSWFKGHGHCDRRPTNRAAPGCRDAPTLAILLAHPARESDSN
eukprot:4177829-Pyramimonas_sp.AAC.1